MSGSCLVIVMAKAPLAGYAKTRLIPALGAEGAAALARRLLERALEQADEAGVGPVELCCAPDAAHPAFGAFARRTHWALSDQGEGDLGERMARAIERGLRRYPKVVLLGTDAPALDATVLRAATTCLDTHDAVFAPALDGGYALIGLRRPAAGLFQGIPWSTPDVMARTRERLTAARLTHAELAPVADIDEPTDLAHLPPGWR